MTEDDLVERLHRRETTPSKYGGFDLINPDGPKAASRIEAQRQTIEGLRSALTELRPHFLHLAGYPQFPSAVRLLEAIDKALAAKVETPNPQVSSPDDGGKK